MNKVQSLYNKYEYLIFLIITLLSASQVFFYYVFPTLDGPHHLYNSNLILGILQGNTMVESYYQLNNVPVSNLMGHALLAFFNSFLPSTTALNLLVFIYIAGMAFSFRYLMVTITGRFSPVNYAVFPFIMNISLILGLFNFCLGIILLFVLMGYWFKVHRSLTLKQLIFMTALLILMAFTHMLTFVFFELTVIVFLVYDIITEYIKNKKFPFKAILLKIFKLVIVTIPAAVILISYYFHVNEILESNISRTINDNVGLFENLYFIRPLIIYHVSNDGYANLPFFVGFVVLILTYIAYRIIAKPGKAAGRFFRNFMLIMTIVYLVLLFVVPAGFILHTIRIRLSLLFFLFLIMWLGTLRLPRWIELLAGLFFLFIFVEHQFRMGPVRSRTSVNVYDMHSIVDKMEENAIFLPVNAKDFWMEEFITNYIGSEKNLIAVKNPQAYGPFPVVFNYRGMPYTTIGGHDRHDINIFFRSGPETNEHREIDYILIYNQGKFDKARENPELKSFFDILDTNFEFVAETPRKTTALYKRISK